jgi:hypothetical protein
MIARVSAPVKALRQSMLRRDRHGAPMAKRLGKHVDELFTLTGNST